MELFTKVDIELLIIRMRTKEVIMNVMETATNNEIPKNEGVSFTRVSLTWLIVPSIVSNMIATMKVVKKRYLLIFQTS
jgi:hypothetical protein